MSISFVWVLKYSTTGPEIITAPYLGFNHKGLGAWTRRPCLQVIGIPVLWMYRPFAHARSTFAWVLLLLLSFSIICWCCSLTLFMTVPSLRFTSPAQNATSAVIFKQLLNISLFWFISSCSHWSKTSFLAHSWHLYLTVWSMMVPARPWVRLSSFGSLGVAPQCMLCS